MQLNLSRYTSFLKACEDYEGSFENIDEFTAIANDLKICCITFKVFTSGRVAKNDVIFGSQTSDMVEQGQPREYLGQFTEHYTLSLRIYRFPNSTPLSEDENEVFEIYANVIFATACRYYLSYLSDRHLNYDYKTRLPNAFYFFSLCDRVIGRGGIGDYCAFFLNCRNMKTVNRMFGERVGDALLHEYTKSFQAILDPDQDEVIAHIGGDNYVILALKSNYESIQSLIIGTTICINHHGDTLFYEMKARSGAAMLNNSDYRSPDNIMAAIGSAHRLSKENDYPDQVLYTRAICDTLTNIDNLQASINDAVTNKRFMVYFQPKIDASVDGTKKLIGAEALVRWRTPDGMNAPSDFIPFAEKSGQIMMIDLYVLEQVCAKLREWIDEGLTPVPISCNFSKFSITSRSVSERIVEIVDRYELDHNLIEIEFKESAFFEEFESLYFTINCLHDAGIKTSIDNFGSSNTSIITIRDLDINHIKISKDFIKDKSKKTAIIMKSIVDLAIKLNIDVICEGIESVDDISKLQELGCHIYQTEIFDKALSPRYFENRLKNPDYYKNDFNE